MKAVILAAGVGSRLGDITKNIPKPMLKIRGIPILERNVLMCMDAGIKEIYINLHHLPDIIVDHFEDGTKYGISIKYNFEEKLLGTAGALIPFSSHISGGDFFVIYGDNNISIDLGDVKRYSQKQNAAVSIVFHWRNKIGSSGIAAIDEQCRINEFIEKPIGKGKDEGWVNAGIYYVGGFNICDSIKIYEDFGYDVFPRLLKMNSGLYAYKTDEKMIAIDTPELLDENLSEG